MSNKLGAILLIAGSLLFLFKDKIDLDNILKKDDVKPVPTVVVDREPSDQMKLAVSSMVDVAKKSNATVADRKAASACWIAAGDVWATLKDSGLTTDKVPLFNEDMLIVFDSQYPSLKNSFPGFGEALKSVFTNTIGDDPKAIDDATKKQISEVCYAIGWALLQQESK